MQVVYTELTEKKNMVAVIPPLCSLRKPLQRLRLSFAQDKTENAKNTGSSFNKKVPCKTGDFFLNPYWFYCITKRNILVLPSLL